MAKKSGFKLPKRVAGVKIPKIIRKGPLGHFLNSQAGQLVIAETLVAAAAAFTAVKTTDEDSAVGETVRNPVDTARRVGHALTSSGSDESARLAHAFRAASRAFRDALRDDDIPAWSPQDIDEAPRAKKKSSARADARLH